MERTASQDILESLTNQWGEYTSSSSEGDSPKTSPVIRSHSQRTSRTSIYSKQKQMNVQYVGHVTHGRSRGAAHLVISSDETNLYVTLTKLGGLHPQFVGISSVVVKVTMETFAGGKVRFQTRPIVVTSSIVTFDETFRFDLPLRTEGHRLLFCVCLKHDEPLFPDKLGWMSFGVTKLIAKNKPTEGWYCLLGKSLGKRKHLMLKKGFDAMSLSRDTEQISVENDVTLRHSNKSCVVRSHSLKVIPENPTTMNRNLRHSTILPRPLLSHQASGQASGIGDINMQNTKNLVMNSGSFSRSQAWNVRSERKPRRHSSLAYPASRRGANREDACYVIVQESRNYLRKAKLSRLNTGHVTNASSSTGLRRPFTESSSSLTKTSNRYPKFRKSFRKPRKVERGRSLLTFQSPKTPIRKFQSDSAIQPPTMLSLSTPPPSVLHSTSPQPAPNCWADFTLSPSFHIIDDDECKALDEITCNAQQPIRKPKPSLLNIILDPLKGKLEKKETRTESVPTPNKKAIKQLGEIFKSRDGHGSTISLCTPDAYFANQQKSRLSRFGAFRLSKRNKSETDALATPMARRRKAGRFSIGDPTTPRKGLKMDGIRHHDFDSDKMAVGDDEFVNATEFFSNKSRRPKWRTFLPKKTATRKPLAAKEADGKSLALETSLLKVLRSKESVILFRHFLALEFSDENLDFWLDVETYKHSKKHEKLALRIFAKYIAEESPREINIESGIRDRIAENLSHCDATLYDEAQSHIFRLMEKDSFRRFLSSSQCRSSSAQQKRPLDDAKRDNVFKRKFV